MKHFFTIILMMAISVCSWAQSIKMKLADKEFASMRYANAIPLYEQLLARDKNKDNTELKIKLAECYRKVNDDQKALRIYAQLSRSENPSPNLFWYYAQALASNRDYPEAANWYRKYAEAVPSEVLASTFAEAYNDMAQFYKDSANYVLLFTHPLNSWQADFSPAFYKNKLVFLSSRSKQEIVRTVYAQDQTAFLDFYSADTASLYSELRNKTLTYAVNKKNDDHSDLTAITCNDTRITGHYGATFLHDSIRYQSDSPIQIDPFESLNTKFHEGPASFTKGHDTVFLTRTTPRIKVDGQKPMSRFALYIARIENGKWDHAEEVPFNGKNFSTGHPALTPNNRKMYFASDRPGGAGGSDIYMVEYNDGVFSEPINMKEINTPGNEMFPYVDANGDLYFSSDGLPGMGGLDIFKVDLENDQVVDVYNMGHPFNSSDDDFGIIWKKDMTGGFLSSNRKRGTSDDDIYSFTHTCRSLNVHVYDSITGFPLDSVHVKSDDADGITNHDGNVTFCMKPSKHSFRVNKTSYEENQITSTKTEVNIALAPLHFDLVGKIKSKEDGSPVEGALISLMNLADSSKTDFVTTTDGTYQFKLQSNASYKVVVSKQSCGTQHQLKSTVGLTTSQTLRGDMDMLCKGDIVKIDNIYYDLNKYDIRPDAAVELDKLVTLFNQYPDMRVEIRSHTDSRSSSTFNMKLSTQRAQAVIDYLGEHGVVPSRMRAAGYGESLPVNGCVDGVNCSEEEYQQNRRTEFVVLSFE